MTECLYRHSKSRYLHGEDGVATPEAPLHLLPCFSPVPPPSTKSRSSSGRILGSVRRSTSAHSRPSPHLKSGSCNSFGSPKAANKAWTPASSPTQVELKPQVISLSFNHSSKKFHRAKSAPVRRNTPKFSPIPLNGGESCETSDSSSVPQLRAQSARVASRSVEPSVKASEALPCQTPKPQTHDLASQKSRSSPQPPTPQSREGSAIPTTKVIRYPRPFEAEVTSEEESESDIERSDEEEKRKKSGDAMTEMEAKTRGYDRQLSKFGWRMQVHGDPYNLK